MRTLIIILGLLLIGCTANRQTRLHTSVDHHDRAEYLLQSGDAIELIVMQRQELSGEYKIGPGGFISLPLVESFKIANLNRKQAEMKIKNALRKHYTPVSVLLKIKSYQNNDFYVIMGEVNEPGVYPIKNRVSVFKALGMAKGLTDDADMGRIQLARHSESGQVYEINLKELLKSGDFSQDYLLQKNDMIFVPKQRIASFLNPLKRIIPAVQVSLLAIITLNQIK